MDGGPSWSRGPKEKKIVVLNSVLQIRIILIQIRILYLILSRSWSGAEIRYRSKVSLKILNFILGSRWNQIQDPDLDSANDPDPQHCLNYSNKSRSESIWCRYLHFFSLKNGNLCKQKFVELSHKINWSIFIYFFHTSALFFLFDCFLTIKLLLDISVPQVFCIGDTGSENLWKYQTSKVFL